jgi:bifunctional DNA primase/polymerase-like protein/primase-like protein
VSDIGVLPEGRRNDGLTRLAGALRRKGASLEEIEQELFKHNERRCQPPLSGIEVSRIAVSVARYPTGGPDPLEDAWQVIEAQPCDSKFARFVALARQLQTARPGQPVALPVDRIGKLMGVHWTTVGLYRKQAVRDGVLEITGKYVAHRRACTYRVAITEQGHSLGTLTSSSTNGLVRIFENCPSENAADAPSENRSSAPSEDEGNKMEINERNAQVLRLAARDFRVFPVKPDKTPLVKWRTGMTSAATSNVDQVEKWLTRLPEANWAVATGKGSDVFVIDIDGCNGLQSFAKCCEQAGLDWKAVAQATLGVKTGRGSHLYFKHPGPAVRNSSKKLAPGIDVRGDGGYVVAPPSMHENGEPYFWLGGDERKPVATAPDWILAVVSA